MSRTLNACCTPFAFALLQLRKALPRLLARAKPLLMPLPMPRSSRTASLMTHPHPILQQQAPLPQSPAQALSQSHPHPQALSPCHPQHPPQSPCHLRPQAPLLSPVMRQHHPLLHHQPLHQPHPHKVARLQVVKLCARRRHPLLQHPLVGGLLHRQLQSAAHSGVEVATLLLRPSHRPLVVLRHSPLPRPLPRLPQVVSVFCLHQASRSQHGQCSTGCTLAALAVCLQRCPCAALGQVGALTAV
jgi:hypothetical protein